MTEPTAQDSMKPDKLPEHLRRTIERLEHIVVHAEQEQRPMPTVGEYISRVSESVPAGSRNTYSGYWKLVEQAWGDRRLNEPTIADITELVKKHQNRAASRFNATGSGGAGGLVDALRCLYRFAEYDGLIDPSHNTARQVPRPPQSRRSKLPLSIERLHELADVAETTGNDRELYGLIVRLHMETACHRRSPLHLHIGDIIQEDCTLRLRDESGDLRWQPISPTLLQHLLEHIDTRGGPRTTTQVLRDHTGQPITYRRYDNLHNRFRKHLPWAVEERVTVTRIRYTTLNYVERQFGKAISRAYGGHQRRKGRNTLFPYNRPGIYDVARALQSLTGEEHLLARGPFPGLSEP
ncbi:site-specific integrase [Nocardia niwae]|uniref:site-specific integrase n=1 Tax=Nocardia niwae TaxID=626084 RepID=UPI0012F4D054|nr:site-specific integrase [Nocardia niwae]